MSIDMAQFHQVFFEESFEGLDIMENGLLDMAPGEADPEEINSIFRAAHSIKGGSGTFGFTDVAEYTHVMETLLDEMRDGRREVTTEGINILLASVDVLRDMLNAAQDGTDADLDRIKEMRAELDRLLANDSSVAPSTSAATPAETASPVAPVAELKPEGWKIIFRPHQHLLRTGNDPLRIIRELAELGEMAVECDLDGLPDFSELEAEDSYLEWVLRLNAPIKKEKIDDIFEWVEDDCDFAVIPVMPADYDPSAVVASPVAELVVAEQPEERRSEEDRRVPEPAANRRKAAPKKAKAAAASSIRVDTGKIDSLINMVGELVITQSMLSLLGEEFSIDKLARLQEGLGQLERHTRELQESVMQVRMLPISFTFSRFPRLVHDLSRQLGKNIELKMTGESTEVDKTVIEKIGDPLVHLVRNSVDHGIEMPEDRVEAGKPEVGTVHLSAEHRGGNIVITIRDDGKGLPRDILYNKGVEKGLIKEGDILSDKQVYDLIFQPGFSTAAVVSDVSGRGVGMDVVRRNIAELGGTVEIESEFGVGSAIIVRLPLTLAILDGQTIAVGKETYIVPLVSIIESIQVNAGMVNMVAGKGETLKLRDEYVPVLRMHDVFDIKEPKAKQLADGIVVIVEGGGRKCGLFVDDLFGQQQVVIKSLEANYGKVEGISGATILGDGTVALIVDIPGLMKLAMESEIFTDDQLALSA